MSNYFSYFSKSKYQFSKTETKNAVDILKRVGLSETLLNDDRNVQSIFVKDGQTPETIAEIAYGDSDFYWVVLLSAKIHNPYYGWPLEYQQLESRLDKEYPGVSLFVSSNALITSLVKSLTCIKLVVLLSSILISGSRSFTLFIGNLLRP